MINFNKMRIFFLTIYIIFYMLYPKIYLFNYIALFLIFSYFFFDIKNIKKIKKIIPYFSLIIIFYFIPSYYYGAVNSSISNFLDFFIRISPIIIGLNELQYMKIESNFNSYKKIRRIIIALIIYICLVNIYYLNTDPYFARIMTNYNYNIPGLSALGTISGGGYFIIYGFIFLVCYFFEYIFINKSIKYKFLYLLLMFLLIIFIIKANFATAFVIAIVSVLILLFIINLSKKNITSLIVLVITILLIINYKDITNLIINELPSDSIISIRLKDAINKNDDSTAAERAKFMQNSFDTIKKHPLIGISAKNHHNYYKIQSQAGLHTEWVDFFARYGIVMAFIYYLFIFKSFKNIIISNIDKKFFISIFISIIILGFLNPILNAGCYLLAFLVIPIFIIGESKDKKIVNINT